jgi:hypothetical protein
MAEQLYYHYSSAKWGFCALERQRMKVSSIKELNDPFEFMPDRRYKYDKRQQYNKVFEDVASKWGLLCFSDSWREQLLWAHYADKHRGMALGFAIPREKLLPVDYDPCDRRTKFELAKCAGENERRFLALGKVKFAEWSYEREYRILVDLTVLVPENCIYYVLFGGDLDLREIVLGDRFPHRQHKDRILALRDKLGVDVRAARVGWENYRIQPCCTRTKWYARA